MDFSSMNMTAFFISLGIYVAVIALDVLVPWLKKEISSWLNYVNIALHIIFLLSLMFVGVNIEIPVLAFMISLFAYSFSFYISYERHKRLAAGAEQTSQEECEVTLPTAPEQPEPISPAEGESTPTDESEETAV